MPSPPRSSRRALRVLTKKQYLSKLRKRFSQSCPHYQEKEIEMDVIAWLKGRGWVSEKELCRMAPFAKRHLVQPVTSKLFERRLVDVRVGGEGRAFKLNKAGHNHATKRKSSTSPPPSLKLAN
jgi:hypothetical protein